VVSQLGDKVDFIIDIEGGGRTDLGVESTVLDISSLGSGGSSLRPRILRPGGCPREEIEALIGPVDFFSSQGGGAGELRSPGQLKSHYAPRTPLVLCPRGGLASLPLAPGEGRLYFERPPGPAGEGSTTDAGPVRFLSESGSLTEAAANLFDMLHELDGLGLDLIRAEEAPPTGLGEAVNDRLRRAEAARL
jgi:L-threonylcarbamoyladenylate synthase